MAKDKKKMKKKTKRILITWISIFSVIAVLVGSFFTYVSIYYHGTDNAASYLEDSTLSEVTDAKDCVTFQPKANKVTTITKDGILFYPGGKVEYKAYAPLLRSLSDLGITSVLVKMPFNLAVFNINGAKNKQEKFPNVENWYMAGHSLGGAMAATYLSKHTSDFKGLILLGAYSSVDLSSETALSTLSILASKDGILNQEKYEKNKSHLLNLTEVTIDGGIHSYFGDYGLQRGDGVPEISYDDQRKAITSYISLFVYGKNIIG